MNYEEIRSFVDDWDNSEVETNINGDTLTVIAYNDVLNVLEDLQNAGFRIERLEPTFFDPVTPCVIIEATE